MKNIRSYADHTVGFEDGVTLFEGDIGSGKSSLLHAIEFALFGLGNLSGQHLLRVGEHEGRVELELEVSGVPYVFGRTLKRRGRSVVQDTCYIVEDDVKTDYNATSMKMRALQILGFREPVNPRSHSVIFRYAIFTPQEQMRDVIRQRPDSRKETLRKAFGIDEYNIASTNAGVVSNSFGENIAVLEKSAELKQQTFGKIEGEEGRRKEASESLSYSRRRLREVKREITEINREIKEKTAKEIELNLLRTEFAVLEQSIKQMEKNIKRMKDEINELDDKIVASTEAEDKLRGLEPGYRKYLQCKAITNTLEPLYRSQTDAENRKFLMQSEIRIQRNNYINKLRELIKSLDEKKEEIHLLSEDLQVLGAASEEAKTIEHEISIIPEAENELLEQRGKIERLSELLKHQFDLRATKQREWGEIEAVGVGARCPRCQQELNEAHYDNLEEKYKQELSKIEDIIANYESNVAEEEAIEGSLESRIKKLKEKEQSLNRLRIRIEKLNSQKATLERVRSDANRMADEVKKTEKLLVNDSFAKETKEKIAALDEELKASMPDVKRYLTAKGELHRLEKAKVDIDYMETKSIAERRQEYEQANKERKTMLDRAKEDLNTASFKLKGLRIQYDREKTVLEDLKSLRDKHTEKTKLEGKLNGVITQLEKEITQIEQRLEELQKEVERYEADILKAEALRLIRVWLNDFFIPTLEVIEKNVLLYINHEFNTLFRRWFETLVESGEMSAIIDQDFAPIVEQDGYELEVESLSGGEKTSVALAYRLALNTVVKQVTDTMKSNLLILDEPTDGFSKDQLYKMRDILTDINCNQVIIVSHESELESVADRIYMVTKENGISQVTRSIQ